MTSLYARLFRYVAREGHSPLENFLTEALADILNRLSLEDNVEFMRRVLIPGIGHEHQAALLSALSAGRRCEWTTQYAIQYGGATKYPDLVLLIEGRPTIIVENKVAAGFTIHQEKIDDSQEAVHQLKVYGRWLARQNPLGALILLTHETEPPLDLTTADAYGVTACGVCRWRHVYRWLKLSLATSSSSPTATLAGELAKFLAETEDTMGVDDPGPLEFSLVHAYHRIAYTKFNSAMVEIDQFIKTRYPSGHASVPINVADQGHRLCGWCRMNPTAHPKGWYVSWGILLPGAPSAINVHPPLPEQEVAFILTSSDADNFPAHKVDSVLRPVGWHWPREQRQNHGPTKTRPLAEMYGSSCGFTEEFKTWLTPALGEAAAILEAVMQVK